MKDSKSKTTKNKKEVIENDDFLESEDENKKAILIVVLSILIVLGLIVASIYINKDETEDEGKANSNIESSSQVDEASKTGRDYTYDDGKYPITK